MAVKNNTIRNAEIEVAISPISAELMSIQDSGGSEFLWQGDPIYWDRRAPNLFPYIGRLTEESYYYNGKRYNMSIHGFLPDAEMSVESAAENSVCYFLRDNENTLGVYPFPFELRIYYALTGNKIDISYTVLNTGKERMFFGIGGHPGFCVPLEPGLAFEDYSLVFAEKHIPVLVGLSERCYLNGKDTEYPLVDGRVLPLKHELFDNDAIILREVCREVALKSDKGTKSVTVSYPDMPYVGIWHWPKTDAPYVCIEPWSSLPSRDNVIEDISRQSDLIGLDPDERYQNTWSIIINP